MNALVSHTASRRRGHELNRVNGLLTDIRMMLREVDPGKPLKARQRAELISLYHHAGDALFEAMQADAAFAEAAARVDTGSFRHIGEAVDPIVDRLVEMMKRETEKTNNASDVISIALARFKAKERNAG